jgi:hypothetical protein
MPSDASKLRANSLQTLREYWNTALTPFTKLIHDHKDNDFYFTLDEIGDGNFQHLSYLLIQLDEQYMEPRALMSAVTILNAREIPAVYACEVSPLNASKFCMAPAKSHEN